MLAMLAVALSTLPAYADDTGAWMQQRQARFAAYHAAHPDPAAAIAAASATTVPATLWDGAGFPEMIVVPAGEFTMGSPDTEEGRQNNEGPRQRVRIGHAFAVSKYPITVGEFAQFVDETHYDAGNICSTTENGSSQDRKGRNWQNPGFAQTSQHPVVCINWNDARAYAAWLSYKTGHAYRLLSDAEYEYSNRAGSTTAWWWGNDIGKNQADCDGCLSPWDGRQTAPVGSFAANPFGLYDTSGNVWSWLSDCWNEAYTGTPNDGSSNEHGDCTRRLLRGGSWDDNPPDLRSAARDRDDPADRNQYNGFRVAQSF
jgi:formylglycine-generating enzyme required for sulfatase activity